jgi:hypothetical protein
VHLDGTDEGKEDLSGGLWVPWWVATSYTIDTWDFMLRSNLTLINEHQKLFFDWMDVIKTAGKGK